MRFYKPQEQYQYFCGIDLHTRTMHLCVLDQAGRIQLHKNIQSRPDAFLKAIAPFRNRLVVACECVFCWYWLADLCADEGIEFVLGHALYMKAIHGGKTKNDRIDSEKIAILLRGGMLPEAYAYPKEMRATRDLLRRRARLVRIRSELLGHIQLSKHQYNVPSFGKIAYRTSRQGVAENFSGSVLRRNVELDVSVIDHLETAIKREEKFLLSQTQLFDGQALFLLRTVPGIGVILAMTLFYEIEDIARFARVQQFASYARLVKGQKSSAGKRLGSQGGKMGNAHLKWAFSEAAILFLRESERAKKYVARLESRHGKKKALSILTAKLGRAVYFILLRREVFEEERFFAAA